MLKLFVLAIILIGAVLATPNNSTNVIKTETKDKTTKLGNEDPNDKVVKTEYGDVRGFQKESGIWQYFDIPYGTFTYKHPFQEPVPPQSWSDILEKTEHTSRCPQIDPKSKYYTGTQDCLTLSIFTPTEPKNNDVLFHIHDGHFSYGSGDPDVYGPAYLVQKGVILVLPNYRLGPLGFLCLQNESIPGNAGLKDLTLALEWTKNNIEAFGGNPSNIAVSGSGSAAALVEYLIISTKSRIFISKAITESGFVLSHWAIDRRPLETWAILYENLSKTKAKTRSVFEEFTEDSITELIEASNGISFRPCIEIFSGGFLTRTPWAILKSTSINIDYMIGSTNFAGNQKALQHTEETLSQINKDYTLLLPNDLRFEGNEAKKQTAERVKKQYFRDDELTLNNIQKLSLCYTDCSFISPAIRGARLFTNAGATVYFYEFSFGPGKDHLSEQGESMKYVFNRKNILAKNTMYQDDEYKMKYLMINLWTSFISSGKPTSENVEWQPLEDTKDDAEKWLSIGSTVKQRTGLHVDRLSLWDEIYRNHFIDRNNVNEIRPSVWYILAGFIAIVTFGKKNAN